jgi:hypothetical protein
MTQLNERQPLRRLGVTHRQLLEEMDRPALKDLPGEPYEQRSGGCAGSASTIRRPLLLRSLPLRPRRGRGAPDHASGSCDEAGGGQPPFVGVGIG